MRRLLLFGLLAALLVPATARAASMNAIIRDCSDDGVLEGHYSAADLRKALRHLPTDVAEYTSCTDVLSRAANAAASAPSSRSGSRGDAGTTGAAPATGPAATPTPADDVKPATPQDSLAIQAAAHAPPPTVQVRGRRSPVALAASVGRNPLPSSLLLVLILLGAASLAVAAPAVRRVLARRRR